MLVQWAVCCDWPLRQNTLGLSLPGHYSANSGHFYATQSTQIICDYFSNKSTSIHHRVIMPSYLFCHISIFSSMVYLRPMRMDTKYELMLILLIELLTIYVQMKRGVLSAENIVLIICKWVELTNAIFWLKRRGNPGQLEEDAFKIKFWCTNMKMQHTI